MIFPSLPASGPSAYGPLLQQGHAWSSVCPAGPQFQREQLGKPSGGYKRVTAKGTRPARRGRGTRLWALAKRAAPGQPPALQRQAPARWGKWQPGKELQQGGLSWDVHNTSAPRGWCPPARCLMLNDQKPALFRLTATDWLKPQEGCWTRWPRQILPNHYVCDLQPYEKLQAGWT